MVATETFIKFYKSKTRAELEADSTPYFYNPDADTREPIFRGSNVFSGYDPDPVVQNVDGKTNRVGKCDAATRTSTSLIWNAYTNVSKSRCAKSVHGY
jgi:hypothetical protein